MKPFVQYSDLLHVDVGGIALLKPVNHPDCSNTKIIRTSRVVSYQKLTGRLETENTVYIPVSPDAFKYAQSGD